jgi:PAS domain S-box-containing protein
MTRVFGIDMNSALGLKHFSAALDRIVDNEAVASLSNEPSATLGRAANPADIDKRWRDLLDALAAAVYLTDPAGVLVYFNRAAAELWGHSPMLGTSQWCGSWRLYWPDGRPMAHDECPMAIALKERRIIRDAEAIAERPDGTRVRFLAYPTPLWNDDGELIGGINLLHDISSRKSAEHADQLLAAIVESSQDAIVSKDLNGIVATWNSGAERLFGYAAEEIVGQAISILIPSDRPDEEAHILERIRKGERVETYETVRQRKDGSFVDVAITVSPVRGADGRIVGASKIARDITERRRAFEHQKLLVGEIKHRIKNSLATVQAIARQTLTSASPDEIEAFVGRLQALAGSHDVLTAENWNRAPLEEVVRKSIEVFDDIDNDRFVVDGRSYVWMDADRSSRLSLVLHELATNAIKYGALSNATGKVMITWDTKETEDGRQLHLLWEERGGPPVEKPRRNGFGSSLIQRALQGDASSITVEYDPEGIRVIFDLRL